MRIYIDRHQPRVNKRKKSGEQYKIEELKERKMRHEVIAAVQKKCASDLNIFLAFNAFRIVRFLDNSQKGVEQDIRYVKPIKL